MTTNLVATNQGTVLEVGAVVDVLGVIDVSRELAPSGKLVTFVFGEEIQTADYAAFAPVRSDGALATMPVRARNVGDRAELCTTLYVRNSQSVPDLSDVDLKKFLKVERDGALVTDYSLSLPRDRESDHRSNTDFCIRRSRVLIQLPSNDSKGIVLYRKPVARSLERHHPLRQNAGSRSKDTVGQRALHPAGW